MNKILNGILILLAIFLVAGFGTATRADEQSPPDPLFPKQGAYFGYIHFHGRKFKIPARIDFLKLPGSSPSSGTLTAFLKITMGNFGTHEYHTEVYSIKDYNWAIPQIDLSAGVPGNGPEISLVGGSFSDDGLRLTGRIRAEHTFGSGNIELVYQPSDALSSELASKIMAEIPVMPLLTGEYQCREADGYLAWALQFEATRGNSGEAPSSNILSGYHIEGRIGKGKAGYLEPYAAFDDGIASLFDEVIRADSYGLECTIQFEGLDCEWNSGSSLRRKAHCYMKRISRYDSGLIVPPTTSVSPPKDFNISGGVQIPKTRDELVGDFIGKLYFEDRSNSTDLYINVDLSGEFLKTTSSGGVDRKNISMHAQLLIDNGVKQSPMVLPIPMLPIDSVIPDSESIIVTCHTDSVLHVLKWDSNEIAGIWYSRQYGRVGRFVVHRRIDGQNPGLSTLNFSRSVAGEYNGGEYVALNLRLQQDRSAGGLASYPFSIGGSIVVGHAYTAPIARGNLDPFSGVINLVLNDGRTFMGRIEGDDIIGTLTSLPPSYGVTWAPHVFSRYRRNQY